MARLKGAATRSSKVIINNGVVATAHRKEIMAPQDNRVAMARLKGAVMALPASKAMARQGNKAAMVPRRVVVTALPVSKAMARPEAVVISSVVLAAPVVALVAQDVALADRVALVARDVAPADRVVSVAQGAVARPERLKSCSSRRKSWLKLKSVIWRCCRFPTRMPIPLLGKR